MNPRMTNHFLCRKRGLLNIAHRGGAAVRPENTLVAFRHALEVGAVVLEGDLHATRDGVVVVCHDATVDRTTNRRGYIREMTLEELQALDAGYRFSPDGGVTYPYRGMGLKIPTLAEVFSDPVLNRSPMSLDIKQREPPIVGKVLDLVEAYEMEDRLILASFHQGCLGEIRAGASRRGINVLTSLAPEEVTTFFLAPLEAMVRGDYVPPGDLLQVPMEHEIDDETVQVVSADFMAKAGAAGLDVQVWTVNDTEEMRWLIREMKVAGIMTDDPEGLQEVMAELSA